MFLPDTSKLQIKDVTIEYSKINHYDSQELRNLIQQLAIVSPQVQVQRCDGNMYGNGNRTQENYPYNAYQPNRGNWNRRSKSAGRLYSNPIQNDLTPSEYSADYDGQNYKPSEEENWTREHVDVNAGNFSNNAKFRSHRYGKRGSYRNNNTNPRNNNFYDSYYQKPYKRYEEKNQIFGPRRYSNHRETSDSKGQRTYNTRDSSSNFKSEPFSYKNYEYQNWDDDYENIDMDISDSENSGNNRNQKRKFERCDDDISIKKTCSENDVHNPILRLKHSDSSDITDDDCVGLNRKYLPSRKGTDLYVKKVSTNAETRRYLVEDARFKQFPLSTKTSCDNLTKQVTTISANEMNSIKTANLKKTNPKNGETQKLPAKENATSSEDVNKTKTVDSPKCPKQRKLDNENSAFSGKNIGNKSKIERPKTPLKRSDSVGSAKSNIIKKPQEILKQLKDVAKISDGVQKVSKSIVEGSKKVEKLGPSNSAQAQPDKTQSKEKKLNCTDEKTTKRERAFSAEELISKKQQEKKFNSSDSKKETMSVRKERAFSLDVCLEVSVDNKEQKTVRKNKKLKISNTKSTESEYVKETPKKVAETKSNDQDVTKDISAVLEKQTHTVVSDKVINNKDVNKSISSLSKQKPVSSEDKVVRNKDINLISTSNTQASSVIRKLTNKYVQAKKVVKKKEDKTSETLQNEQAANKPRTSTDCASKAKDESDNVRRRKTESENPKLSTPSKNNANVTISVSNQKLVNNGSSKVCEKKCVTTEKTTPLREINAKPSELVQKMSRNSVVQVGKTSISGNEEKSKMKTSAADVGIVATVESVAKPNAKKILQRRGKSCDSRSFSQESYLEALNLRPLTRSKSVDPSEFHFTSFRITRSKSVFYGLFSGLSPPTRRRSRSRSSSSMPGTSEKDKIECDARNKNNSERILKASEEVKVYKPLLIDMEHRKSVVSAYSPRDDDDEVAMHMANYSDGAYAIQHRAIDPRDPRKNQLTKKTLKKNGKELIKLKDFMRELVEEKSKKSKTHNEEQTREMQNMRETKPANPRDKFPKQRKPPSINALSPKGADKKCAPANPRDKFPKERKHPSINALPPPKGADKKCAPSSTRQIKKPDMPKLNDASQPQSANKLNVGLEEIEGYFPRDGENKNCLRLNVSNGTEERAVTIQKADVLQINIPAEETNILIPDPIVSERAEISNVPNPLEEATVDVIAIQEANQSEKVIDLTSDDSCEEQSDLTSINSINKLTEQLLEMYGDDVRSSILKPESSTSPDCLLNILESPIRRRDDQTVTNETDESSAPYTIIVTPLLQSEPDKEAESITIEIPGISTMETSGINSHNTPETASTNCLASEISERTSTNFETQVQKNPEGLNNNAEETNLNESRQRQSSPQFVVPDFASMNLDISIIPLGDASRHGEVASSSLIDTVGPNRSASELPKTALSNETHRDGLPPPPPTNAHNSVLPNVAASGSSVSIGILSSQTTNQRKPSNRTVSHHQTPPALAATTYPSNSVEQQILSGVNQNRPVERLQHIMDFASMNLDISILGDVSRHNEVASSSLIDTVGQNRSANETHQDGLPPPPPTNAHNSVLPNVAASGSSASIGILSSQSTNQRKPSNRTVSHHQTPPALAATTCPSNSVEQQILSGVDQNRLQHIMENFNRRGASRDNSEVPPNRIAPCQHQSHLHTSNDNNRAYREFLSNNVYYILRYQCIMDLVHHMLPSYIQHLSETSTKNFTQAVMQSFFENMLTNIERDLRQYYNSVKLENVKFSMFLVDLDIELGRSGQKLFWKWNLEFLYRLLCRNTNCKLSLNACYQRFTSDLKLYYETYVNNLRTAQNAQNNSTERVSRPTCISVVPLSTLQSPTLHSPNSSTNSSNVQRSDVQQQTQSVQRNNNAAVQSVPSTFNQTGRSQTCGMTRKQFQIFLRQVEKCKQLDLLSRQQNTASGSNYYVGGNTSGWSGHRRPSQGSVVHHRATNRPLGQNCNQLERGREETNLHRLLTGQASSNDYSQNLHSMINARISNADGGFVSGQGCIQRIPPPVPVNLSVQHQQQHNKQTQPRTEMNDQRARFSANPPSVLPQQQRRPENCFNLPPRNDARGNEMASALSRKMADMARSNLLVKPTYSEPQVFRPRSATEQNSAAQQIAQNLNLRELNVADTRNNHNTPQEQITRDTTVQPVTRNSSAQNSQPKETPQQMQVDISSVTESESARATQHSESDRNTPPKEDGATKVAAEVNERQTQPGDEFIDFENYLCNTHGENWDDDIQMFWPENYVVPPIAESVKYEADIEVEDVEEDDPIPRSESNDSGIESPTDLLPSQIQLPGSLYEGRFCFCGKPAVYVCTCQLQMYCSEICQMSDWHRHGHLHG